MIFVKLAVVSWILFFIVRFFVASQVSDLERLFVALNGKMMKMTPGRVILILIFLAAVGLTVASIIWFLFFSGII